MQQSLASIDSIGNNIPDVMTAAQQIGYGDAKDVLQLKSDVPVPKELKSSQILVRNHAVSINAIDWKLLNGNMSIIKTYAFPHIPGMDCSGTVIDVGSSIKRLKIGDAVYGNLGYGNAFAEYVYGDESLFALKPANLSFTEAAAIPLAAETAYEALFEQGKITRDSKVFICGGPTGVGLFAIQFAKAVGAHVACTSSTRNMDTIKKLGYNVTENVSDEMNTNSDNLLVIDYTKSNFGEVLRHQNYDVVFDCVGGQEQWESAQQILKPGGCFITIVGDDPHSNLTVKNIVTVGAGVINRKFWSLVGQEPSYIFHVLKQDYRHLDDIRENYIETKKVKPLIDRVYNFYNLEELHEMYDRSKSRKAQGKMVAQIIKD